VENFAASERARIAEHDPDHNDDDGDNDNDPLTIVAAQLPAAPPGRLRSSAAANVHIPPAGIHNLVVHERI
jgi:hypothetical protein